MSKITLDVTGRDYGLEVVDYAVTEEATPLVPGDSSGGVGSIRVSTVARKDGPHYLRTATILDRDILLTDREDIEFSAFKGRGSVRGHVTSNAETGGRVNITAETLLARLNTDRKAAPVFGARKYGTRVTYIVNNITNPSLETATTNYAVTAGTGGTAGFTMVNTAGLPRTGSYCGRAAWTVGASGLGGIDYTQAVVAGSTSNYSGYLRLANAKLTQTIRLTAQFMKTGGTPTGAPFTSESVQINNTDYTRVNVVGTAPSDAVSVKLSFYNYTTGISPALWEAGDILLIDSVMATQGTELYDYFDGSFADSSWQGTANASSSQTAISTLIDEGIDATIANAVRYYCGLVGIQPNNIIIDSEFEGVPVAYPAWEGNVWNYLKMLCVAVGAEIAMSDTYVLFRAPRKHTVQHENFGGLVPQVSAQSTARNIEIYNYNNRWLVDSIAHAADNVLSVDVGATTLTKIKVPHSLIRVNNPQAVSSLSDPATYVGSGEYVVKDANDVVVDAQAWAALGARVTAGLTYDTYDTIELVITGPSSAGAYTAPFRIASAAGTEGGLTITGEGVFTDKQIMTLATAASDSQTSTEVAATIDNPFISNPSQAGDRGVLAAMRASGPTITISGRFAFDRAATGADFDRVVGGRVRLNDNIFRVKSATFTPQAIDIDAEADVLFSDLIEVYSITFSEFNDANVGATFTSYNATWAPTDTFDDMTDSQPQPSFDDVNTLYEGMTFNDHALYPLIPLPASMATLVTTPPEPAGGYGGSAYGSEPYGD